MVLYVDISFRLLSILPTFQSDALAFFREKKAEKEGWQDAMFGKSSNLHSMPCIYVNVILYTVCTVIVQPKEHKHYVEVRYTYAAYLEQNDVISALLHCHMQKGPSNAHPPYYIAHSMEGKLAMPQLTNREGKLVILHRIWST